MSQTIIWTIATITVLGFLLALVLYLVAKKFKVEEDPRIDEVEKAMPGANCGGCGFAGCRAFAESAVKATDLDSHFCPVGGNDTMAKVAAILGYEVKAKAPQVAVVRCNGSCEVRPKTNEYDGYASCKVKATLYAGDTGCAFGCLGCGDCVAACQFDAIHMDPATGLPVVDEAKCTACGACAKACPKRIIELRAKGPRGMREYVSCINQDKGPAARKACANACIGCGICVKTCTHEAIVLENNVAYIDPAKCKLCRECEAVCPTGAIHGVNFPKPLDKEAVKERIKLRQQKAKEAAALPRRFATLSGQMLQKRHQLPLTLITLIKRRRKRSMARTFSIGGVHPHDSKISRECRITVGDKVKVGQPIAEPGGFVSAFVHSSVSGTVKSIGPRKDLAGKDQLTIEIAVEGDDWLEGIDTSDTLVTEIPADSKAILEKIRLGGVVGLGGATFPTHVKLSPPPGSKCECLIINGCECEPYLTSDFRTLLEKGEQVVVGAAILQQVLGHVRCVFGIEVNKPEAIAHIREVIAKLGYKDMEVLPLRKRYPQGGEKQLIDAVMHRQVGSGALPISVGAVVQNVATALAVYDAVQKNKPVIDNSVTVTGECFPKQANLLVRVGTPLSFIIDHLGGMPADAAKVISGGPMMGRAIANLDAATLKGTSALLFLTEKQTRRAPESACIRCGKCADACPMGLEPFLLHKLSRIKDTEALEANAAQDCIECGCCLYSDNIRLAKGEVLGAIRARAAAAKAAAEAAKK